MASMLTRAVTSAVRRCNLKYAVRYSSAGPAVDPMKGKAVSETNTMPDTLGHSVGPERYELLAKLAGNEDPFEMNVKQRGPGTRSQPNLVPSIYEKRLVGCICEEDATCINWMQLHKGEPKRCECGHWFQLSELKQVDYSNQ